MNEMEKKMKANLIRIKHNQAHNLKVNTGQNNKIKALEDNSVKIKTNIKSLEGKLSDLKTEEGNQKKSLDSLKV